jgi:hypothetical protein
MFFIYQRFIDTLRICSNTKGFFSPSEHKKSRNFFLIDGQEVATFFKFIGKVKMIVNKW